MARSEQRQHINLSAHADEIIHNDMNAFEVAKNESGFICEIISTYWHASDASIAHAKNRKRDKLTREIKQAKYREDKPKDKKLERFEPSKYSLSEEELALVEKLANEYAIALELKMKSFPKDVSKKIRLRNEVYDLVYPEDEADWPCREFYSNQGDYLKAIIEDYASKTFFEREAIICHDLISDLQREIDLPNESKCILGVTLYAKNGKAAKFDVKPYRIMSDPGANYHYLVGMSRPAGEAGAAWKEASFRISRIEKFRPYAKSHGSGKITKTELKTIMDALRVRGVQYILSEQVEQKILLTPEGMRMYDQILHMRPVTAKKPEKKEDGNTLLVFLCTERQIENYFFPFGEEAKVLKPEHLADRFRERYEKALLVYSE